MYFEKKTPKTSHRITAIDASSTIVLLMNTAMIMGMKFFLPCLVMMLMMMVVMMVLMIVIWWHHVNCNGSTVYTHCVLFVMDNGGGDGGNEGDDDAHAFL